MGDIADMILEGLLDEETGEYVGDINEKVYGVQSPGFPVSHSREKASCPDCGKRVKAAGLAMHVRAVHSEA